METEPLVRVVRGAPAEIELAALVTVLAARSTKMDSPAASAWSRSARPSTRPASWRQSGMPG
jgi:hypothetical protein